jgi:hypothetical protein
MIIADFFKTQAELDEFILSLPVNSVTRINGGVLRIFQCENVDGAGNARGARLVKNIFPPDVHERLEAEVPAKKKHHRH